ncbi:hypothetical protein [Actinomadura madurae]|uniref:hypothetical protein n=1 Tax=Actinomadura madurae TaxID=1993 RepID=UPI0020D23FE7|nr:hypothetical protein [Actinomadura madurae]MCQ0015874.1 hypothetical protein [Actinomadura madurae]
MDEAAAREAEHAARLLGYLRDLARARRRPSRDLADHDHVHWLADLPGDVYVERHAGPGEVLFSVPVIPLTPPVVLDEFDGWLALRTWYRVLRDLAGEEVVLATGLLSWRPAVHDHLLSTPVRIVLDERTERVDVVLDGHTALRDRELLSGHPGFRPAAWVAEAVQAGQGFGLNASTGDVLRKWCQVSLTTPADCREDWAPGTDTASPVPRLRLAPALVVRPPGPRGRRRPPRPAAQPAAARRPRRARPVRVTGQETADHARPRACAGDRPRPARGAARPRPPGARRHLRPHRVRQPARRAPARPRRPHRHRPGDGGADGGGDPGPRRVPRPGAGRRARGGRRPPRRRDHRAAPRRRVGRARAGPRRRGPRTVLDARPAGPARRPAGLPLRGRRPRRPPRGGDRRAQGPHDPAGRRPGRAAERRLRADPGRRRGGRRRTRRTVQDGPVAAPPRLRPHVPRPPRRGRVRRRRRVPRPRPRRPPRRLEQRRPRRPRVRRRPRRPAPPHLGPGLGDDLPRPVGRARPGRAGRPHRRAARGRRPAGARRVRPGSAHPPGGGGTLKRGPLRPAVQRQAEPLLTTVTVDGVAPTTPELLDLVHTDLMVRITCRELQYVWEAAGISFPADLPPAERVARFVRAHARLARVRDAMQAVDSTRRLLERSGFGIRLTHPVQWHEYASALRNALEGLGVSRAAADLEALRDSIGPLDDDDPPSCATPSPPSTPATPPPTAAPSAPSPRPATNAPARSAATS